MQGDLNRSTSKKTATGKDYQLPIFHIYFTPLHQFLLLNFDPNKIKVNKSALEQMVRMREESLFSWQHP